MSIESGSSGEDAFRGSAFMVLPTPDATHQFRALDPALRQELQEQLFLIGCNPAGMLGRTTGDAVHVGAYEYSYRSNVVEGLTIRVIFASIDLSERIAVLAFIATLYGLDD